MGWLLLLLLFFDSDDSHQKLVAQWKIDCAKLSGEVRVVDQEAHRVECFVDGREITICGYESYSKYPDRECYKESVCK